MFHFYSARCEFTSKFCVSNSLNLYIIIVNPSSDDTVFGILVSCWLHVRSGLNNSVLPLFQILWIRPRIPGNSPATLSFSVGFTVNKPEDLVCPFLEVLWICIFTTEKISLPLNSRRSRRKSPTSFVHILWMCRPSTRNSAVILAVTAFAADAEGGCTCSHSLKLHSKLPSCRGCDTFGVNALLSQPCQIISCTVYFVGWPATSERVWLARALTVDDFSNITWTRNRIKMFSKLT